MNATGAPDLVVHVGVGASGTLLASAVPLLAGELARHGVRTADEVTVPPVGDAAVLVFSPDDPPAPSDPSDAWAFCSLTAADVAGVVAASGAQRARIVLCPERQDRLLERSYRAAVAGGFAGRLGELFPRRFRPLLRYRPLLSALQDVPGVRDVRVLPVELAAAGAPAYVAALLATLDTERPIELAAALADWRVPREYSPRGVRIARAMLPHLDTDLERARVREYVLANFHVPAGAAPAWLPGRDRARIVEAHRAVNRAFFAAVPEYPAGAYGGRAGGEALRAVLDPVVLPGQGAAAAD